MSVELLNTIICYWIITFITVFINNLKFNYYNTECNIDMKASRSYKV